MPELPDITLYIEALERRVLGAELKRIRISSPFLLRTASPPLESITGLPVLALRRIGKWIAFGFEKDFWLVLHLMIAGRLHWADAVAASSSQISAQPERPTRRLLKPTGKNALAAFEFSTGVLHLTEAGTKRRASLHLVPGESALKGIDRGGLEVLDCGVDEFAKALRSENHTLKRALTDPRLFSGIGNSYSDEILHAARLSPVALTQRLSDQEVLALHRATQDTLKMWIERLRRETGEAFPEGVTAFRPGMAVHGKFGQPCPVCGAAVQRIRYADNETNYCPKCQTGGKLLADRSLSLLLKRDWPRTPEQLEEMRERQGGAC